MAKRQPAMTKTKICPYCGETIKSVAIKCRYCGSMLAETSPSSWQNYNTMIRNALAAKYQIIEEVGKGGMAIVYRAIQKNLNREIALKVIHPNLVHDAEFLGRFHSEAQLAASLNHQNIVKIYDEGESQGVHYMAMEFLDGEDLQKLIRKKTKLSPSEAIEVIKPIAGALHYIHSKGLIHRDIKSSNIIVTRDGRPVLTDFGIARASDGPKMTQLGAVFGTPEYMSPEQAQGKTLDHRSDLFSLGIVLYECLTGCLPFKGETPLLTINQVLSGNIAPPVTINKEIPSWLNELVMGLLIKDPNQRVADNGNTFARLLEGKGPFSPARKPGIQKTKKKALVRRKQAGKPTPSKSKITSTKKGLKALIWMLTGIVGVIISLVVILAIQTYHTKEIKKTEGTKNLLDTPVKKVDNSPSVPVFNTPLQVEEIPATPSPHQSFPEPKQGTDTLQKMDTIRPYYQGGLNAIRGYLRKYIQESASAANCISKGTVKILVMVHADGSMRTVRAVQGIQPECEILVMDAIEHLPKNWVVGKINGKPTSMGYIISYTFQ